MFAKGMILSALLWTLSTSAAPAAIEPVKRGTITSLSSAQISRFKPFTFFASSAYCNPSTTINWSCGAKCAANADFIPVASGGDGGAVQFWYVGYSPSQASVVVAHQGTNLLEIETDATDITLFLGPLKSSLFPGISSSIMVHSGFANAHAKTATAILAAVNTAITSYAATKVTLVGHSLGAAIALLDGVYLPLHISGVSFSVIGYGMPRVGNRAFANYVDAHLSLTHINNREDFVPITPDRSLGYRHPSGEVHIRDNGQWVSCPGQENTSAKCIVGDVPNVFFGSIIDHVGPYDGVVIEC